jgi:hypothetical protein
MSSLNYRGFRKFIHFLLSETAMPITPHLVEQAASILKSSTATPKQKLILGGKLLRAAMMFSQDWPPEMLERATTAYKFLLKSDCMKRTLKQMDEKDVNGYLAQFTKDVTQLAADIEQARSQQPRKS